MEIWPNFFIVGTSRAGTTSLYEYLLRHPEIFMSSIKEPAYFSPNYAADSKWRIKTEDKYLNLFKAVRNYKCIGEASTSYLHDQDSPKLIHQKIPYAKIIIILRDPVERAFSHYLMITRNKKKSLSELITNEIEKIKKGKIKQNMIYSGLYSEKVQRYFNLFGKENVKIVIFENFVKNVSETVKEILKFLGVEHKNFIFDDKAYNVHRLPRNKYVYSLIMSEPVRKVASHLVPISFRKKVYENILVKQEEKSDIPSKDKKFLENYYLEDVLELQKILNKNLPWFINS